MWSSFWIRKRQKILNKLFSYICTSQAASLLADSSYNQCMRCENVADLVETRSLRTLWTFFSYLSTVYSSILYTGYWAPSCFCQPVHLRRDCESEYFNTVNCCHQVAARCHCTEHKRLFNNPLNKLLLAHCCEKNISCHPKQCNVALGCMRMRQKCHLWKTTFLVHCMLR